MSVSRYSHHNYVGNYGDVIKHVILTKLLQYYVAKTSSFHYIDSHAGDGQYNISAKTHPKANQGIYQLRAAQHSDPLIENYLNLINQFSKASDIDPQHHLLYPGSPMVAASILRQTDSIELFEQHSKPFAALQQHCAHQHTQIHPQDGFEGCLQFKTRQGVLLIDPPYDQQSDYSNLQHTLKNLKNSPLTIMVWHPLTGHNQQNIEDILSAMQNKVTFELKTQQHKGAGIILQNCPASLKASFKQTVDCLNQIFHQN